MSKSFQHAIRQFLGKRSPAITSTFKRTKSTDTNILKSVYPDLQTSNYTVNDFVWQNLDRWPDKTVAVCAATGHGYTYAQAHRMSISLAASLRSKLKLQNGDKVAIILPNIPEYPCTILGVLQAGCVASMMNPAYTVRLLDTYQPVIKCLQDEVQVTDCKEETKISDELQRQISLVDCKAVVTSSFSYNNVCSALKNINSKIPVILISNEDTPDGAIKFSEFAEDFSIDTSCLKSVHTSPKDVAILPFSSGTTGFPKGVVLTHKSVVAMNQMILSPNILAVEEATATYQAAIPAILPFFHIFGFNAVMLNLMTVGVKLITMPSFKPELFLQTMVKHKTDHLYIVPPVAVFLGKHPAVKPEHLASIIGIVSGAAPLSESDAAAILNKNKNIVFRQGYGLTETNGGVSVGYNNDTNHSSVGHPFPSCEIKIADLETQEALPPGKEGEIWFRGPNLMTEYYNDEAATKDVLTEDGWYKTGDIGKYDTKSYLYVTDRLKELIKVKGFQVPPAELETVIRTHPKILDCAVLGISDPVTGESPKAFLVPQSGQEISPEDIMEYVNTKVAVFKHIKSVQFVNEIPKNPAGKILRKVLKEKYC